MAISRKPKPQEKASVDVEALINKGGSVAGGDNDTGEKSSVPVILRVPQTLLTRIDEAVAARPIRTPRHTWMLEAVLEKLERETR